MSTICPASRPFCLGTLMIPRMRLRVVCGFGEMMASFSPTSAFSSVLLTALGRPRIQTNPEWKDMGLGYRSQVSGVRCQVSAKPVGGETGVCAFVIYLYREGAARFRIIAGAASPVAGQRSDCPERRKNQKQLAAGNARLPCAACAYRCNHCG